MNINLASLADDWQRSLYIKSNHTCVFISHKKEDEAAAIAIGSFLVKQVGVNIYLDLNDCELKEAVSAENDKKIVDSVKIGLEYSTHLLCIVSDRTKLSWWVPYEIGYAEKKGLDISPLKLKGVEDIPSYLKIKKVLYTQEDFLRYLSRVPPMSVYFSESNYRTLSSKDRSSIEEFIDK